MRVLVCGSRTWSDYNSVIRELKALDHPTIIHGCARGADQMADQAATSLGFIVERFPANWERYGRSAGIIRNCRMLDSGVDRVLAFWDGVSRGTQHTINEARRRGIHVDVVMDSGRSTDSSPA